MTTPIIDAFERIARAEVLQQRLTSTVAELSNRPGLTEEKKWLEAARTHIAHAREGIGDLLTRALRLAELDSLKGGARGRALQGAAVDAVERLHSAIVAAGGERSPLIETFYRELKLPALRRCGRDEFEKFCAEFEKRLGSSYARRMLADPSLAVLEPRLQQVRRAFGDWRGVFASPPAEGAEAQSLREDLEATAGRLELPCRQARLLAEAALAPLPELLDSSGILGKPRRRAPRPTSADPPASESAPPDEETDETDDESDESDESDDTYAEATGGGEST